MVEGKNLSKVTPEDTERIQEVWVLANIWSGCASQIETALSQTWTLANHEAKKALLYICWIQHLRVHGDEVKWEFEWILPKEFSEYFGFFNQWVFVQFYNEDALCIPLTYFQEYNPETTKLDISSPLLPQLIPWQQNYWDVKKVLSKKVPWIYAVLLTYSKYKGLLAE